MQKNVKSTANCRHDLTGQEVQNKVQEKEQDKVNCKMNASMRVIHARHESCGQHEP